MDRRAFLVAVLAASACGRTDTPRSAVPRVAILVYGSQDVPTVGPVSAATLVRQAMTKLGYVDGKTVVFEEHYADGNPERLRDLARQNVDSKPDVTLGIPAAATAALRQATGVIPIVMAHAGDPVGRPPMPSQSSCKSLMIGVSENARPVSRCCRSSAAWHRRRAAAKRARGFSMFVQYIR